MINSIMQIRLAVLDCHKIYHSYKEHLWKERKNKAHGIILYVSSGFLTMICIHAYLSLMQKAYPNLLLLVSWRLPSPRRAGRWEAALPQEPAQTMSRGEQSCCQAPGGSKAIAVALHICKLLRSRALPAAPWNTRQGWGRACDQTLKSLLHFWPM